jgi:hypothetical protein
VKPTDDTIALATFLLGKEWWDAASIREALAQLGFRRPSTQWLASHLSSMCEESAPRFERRKQEWAGVAEYRVTSWAATGLSNQWRGFDSFRADRNLELPTPKPEHLRSSDGQGGER